MGLASRGRRRLPRRRHDGHRHTVETENACFTPTTLHVEPGTTVTWVNEDDAMVHDVTANQWGHGEPARVRQLASGSGSSGSSPSLGWIGGAILGFGLAVAGGREVLSRHG